MIFLKIVAFDRFRWRKRSVSLTSVQMDLHLKEKVEEALESLRPYLEAEGGSVRLVDITNEMVAEVELLGACETCPMSTMTLRAGIEQAVKRFAPQITRVEAVRS